MKKYSVLFFFTFLSLTVLAQKGKITGKVTNTRNEGLAGVTIKISGAANGFSKTDIEGRFSLPLEAEKNTVSFYLMWVIKTKQLKISV